MKKRRESPTRHDVVTQLHADVFDMGRRYTNWRPRGSRDYLLIYTAAGAGYLTTPNAEGATRVGEVTLYAPDDYQDYRTDPAAGRWRLLWTHFIPRPSWKPWLSWPAGAHGVKSIYLPKGEIRDGFVAAMERMIADHRRPIPFAAEFGANGLEEALLWAHVSATKDPWTRIDPRVRRAMEYLSANLQQPFHLGDLARHCGLSVSRLAHLFKQQTSSSPQQYFEQQRMWQAGQLLRSTGLGIKEIAVQVGYDDPFYFTNRFRKYSGQSPSNYRRQTGRG